MLNNPRIILGLFKVESLYTSLVLSLISECQSNCQSDELIRLKSFMESRTIEVSKTSQVEVF